LSSQSVKKRSTDLNLPKAKQAVSRFAVDRLAQSKVADVELLERMMIEQEEKQSDHLNSLEYKWRDVLNQLQKATDQMEKSQLLRSCVNQAAKAIRTKRKRFFPPLCPSWLETIQEPCSLSARNVTTTPTKYSTVT
jgi:hypothetical protein